MLNYPDDFRKRQTVAAKYDQLSAYTWLADQLASKISEDLRPIIGAKDPFQDYCSGRISREYFCSLHPAAVHLTVIRTDALTLISEIEEAETDLNITDESRRRLQEERREFTNLTIDSYPEYLAHILSTTQTR